MAASIHPIHSEGFSVGGAALCRIPDGIYLTKYHSFATANMFGAAKLIVRFAIAEGDFTGAVLERFYNVRRLVGKAGQKGGFEVGMRSDFIREYARVTGHAPARLDRIPMTRLRGRIITAQTKTVSRDRHGFEIPEGLKYSSIEYLVSGEYLATSIT